MKNEEQKNGALGISPQEYGELLRCLDLRDIFLTEAKVSSNRTAFSGNVTLFIDEKITLVHLADDSATVDVEYTLRGKSEKRNVIVITAKFSVGFHLNSPIPSGFFEIYNKSSLQLQVFPYFREFVQSSVGRMGFPPLIMPLRKFIPAK